MATRKSRQNTESPTFTNETAPSTPSTPATRNTRSIRNKQLQQNKGDETTVTVKSEKIDEDDDAVKDTQIEDEIKDGDKEKTDAKDDESICKDTESTPPSASTRKRRTAANAKDEQNTQNSDAVSSADDGKTSPNKLKRSRRSAFELLTGTKPDENTSLFTKRRNSTGKLDKPTRKLSSRIKKLKQLRKTTLKRSLLKKSDKLAATVTKPQKQVPEKLVTKAGKIEKNDSASDTEVIKMSRRRSDSMSKCSDLTDASSFQETKDNADEADTASSVDASDRVEIKQEAIDKEDAQSNKADSEHADGIVSPTITLNDSAAGESDAKNDSDSLNDSKRPRTLRRGKRSNVPIKVINTRSRSQTPCKSTEDDDDKASVSNEIKTERVDTPLHIETVANEPNTEDKADEAKPDNSDEAKTSKSLSPVLVSEGVSEISVKQFYGRADFLENNLGIENDPKLGEIVQEQEKNKETITATSDEQSETAMETTELTDTEPSESDAVDNNEQPSEAVENIQDISIETIEDDDRTDGANNDAPVSVTSEVDCFIKPSEVVRRNSTAILNENMLVLNGVEIEFTKKENRKEAKKIEEDDVGEVVLYAISSNGKLMKPEKLETVLESQRVKELERSDSMDSNETKGITVDSNGIQADSKTEQITFGDESVKSKAVLKALKSIDNEQAARNKENKLKESNDAESVDDESDSNGPPSVSNSIGSRSSSIDDESPEEKVQKESHLKELGLLTHQAAVEATIEKQKQREQIKATISSATHGTKGKKNAEYTGTLKTIIKLHRGNNNDKKKTNQSLKLTLQKGRGKNGADKNDPNSQYDDDTYYTIQQHDADVMGKCTSFAIFKLVWGGKSVCSKNNNQFHAHITQT